LTRTIALYVPFNNCTKLCVEQGGTDDHLKTLPHKDTIVPQIRDAWDQCRSTFGEGNVLIVSNSAGTRMDPGGIQVYYIIYRCKMDMIN